MNMTIASYVSDDFDIIDSRIAPWDNTTIFSTIFGLLTIETRSPSPDNGR